MRLCLPAALVREVTTDLVGALLIFAAVLALALTSTQDARSAPAEPMTEKPVAAVQPPLLSEARRGSLYLHSRDGVPLPVTRLSTDVEIAVNGPVARAVVRQRFRNAGNERAVGAYVFPLPDRASVDALRMEIGERTVEGRIKSRQDARALYEQAKAHGADLSLIEEQRPDIFTAPVANVAPGETIVVRIEYQGSVQRDDNAYQIRFPLRAAPRDGTGGNEPVSLRVRLRPGFAVGDIESRNHAVSVQRSKDGGANLTLTDVVLPKGRDFELRWSPNAQATPQVAVFHEPVDEIDYVLAMVTPPATDPAVSAPPRDVIFVVDTSSSMRGVAIEQAKASVALALAHLQPRDRFNVIGFGTEVQRVFNSAVEATPENLAIAGQFVSGLAASGGTDIARALEAALVDASPGDPRPRQIILVTDDTISKEATAFSTVAGKRGRSRLFLVGIGATSDTNFMRRLAEVGRGAFTHIGSTDEVEDRMQELFRKLERPAVTDLRVDWTPGVRVEAWPDPLPDVYAGEPVVIAAQLSSLKGDLTVSGKLGGKPWKTAVKLAETPTGAGVAKLWARRKIAALEARRWSGQDRATIARAIRTVALEHRLVSAETSLVAVGPASPAGAPGQSGGMPLHLPADTIDRAASSSSPARTGPTSTSHRPLLLREALAPEPAPAADMRSGAVAEASQAQTEVAATGTAGGDRSATVQAGGLGAAFNDRLLVVAVMAMFFAAMVAVTLGFWRHLSREDVSTRRPGRGI